MDFMVGLPHTRRQHDLIWVIVDRITKSAHFILIKASFLAEDYAKLYIKDIIRMHGIPLYILDRQVKRLRNKEVASIKGLWRNHQLESASREAEANMKSRYPHIFSPTPIQI